MHCVDRCSHIHIYNLMYTCVFVCVLLSCVWSYSHTNTMTKSLFWERVLPPLFIPIVFQDLPDTISLSESHFRLAKWVWRRCRRWFREAIHQEVAPSEWSSVAFYEPHWLQSTAAFGAYAVVKGIHGVWGPYCLKCPWYAKISDDLRKTSQSTACSHCSAVQGISNNATFLGDCGQQAQRANPQWLTLWRGWRKGYADVLHWSSQAPGTEPRIGIDIGGATRLANGEKERDIFVRYCFLLFLYAYK